MKVINYGPGYEPKTHKCIWCNSEFEYENKEVKHEKYYLDLDGKYSIRWDGTYDCVVIQREVLKCPVCLEKITLKQDQCHLEPIKPSQEEPKKQRWFSRKEN